MSQNVNMDQLAKIIEEQIQTQNMPQSRTRRTAKRSLLTKTLLMAVSGFLIFGSLLYLGVAWYTRVTSTHAVTFEVADYELAISDNTDEEFLVNVYEYTNVQTTGTEQTMAPGTAGYIPLRLSARHSDIDVDFSIIIKNRMPEELQKHIRFFYLVDKTTKEPAVCSVVRSGSANTSAVVAADAYKFMSDPKAGPDSRLEKKYLDIYPNNADDITNLDAYSIKGTIQMDTEKLIYIYWEWYLDAEDALKTHPSYKAAGTTAEQWEVYCEKWDALDTDMGRYPQKYYDSMFVHLTCIGVQSVPELKPRT